MILLSLNNVTKHFGPDPVLDGVTFDIRAGERVSLVGPNGAGKTTLMRIIAGQETPDGGDVALHSSARLGYLEQQPDFAADRTVWEEARDALSHLIAIADEAERIAAALANVTDGAERARLGKRFDHLQHELQIHDGYHLDHKIERVLTGLGFAPESYQQPVVQLSGGQQNRLLLARLLLSEPDLMLLDEPSNHLDIEATEWLENYLSEARQAILVVSHDRYFLDRVTRRTLELFHGTVDSYKGNFSAYWQQKAERLLVQQRTYEKQQLEIGRMEDFVRRNSYGLKHAQAEDRRKKLERIERVELPREIAAPPMGFPAASRSGDIVLRVEHLSKRFDQPLFKDLSVDILRGEKWGILGPNGSGKTTLLRCMLGQIEPDEGRVINGAGVSLGYFDQMLADLDGASQVVDAIRPPHKEFIEQQRRDMLARFGVTGDMVFQRVDSLSGGERNRTALARLASLDANLLVLDEPTNHLDLWARDSLERALTSFDGTVIFVSHDRYFLNRVADHVLVIEPGKFRVVDGNYEMYLYQLQNGPPASKGTGGEKGGSAAAGKEKKGTKSKATGGEPRRKRRFPYRKVADLEHDIAGAEAGIEEIHTLLASPDVLRDGERVKSLKEQLDQLQATLANLYEHWEEAAELN